MATPRILFYDGRCGLCHGAVRFVLRQDPGGPLKLAPLQGETFEKETAEEQRLNLPDSLVLLMEDGRLLTRSTSVVALLRYLGGGWGWLGRVLGILPRPLRDAGYRLVAAVRHRIFKRPETLCPILPPEVRPRFLP